MADNSITWNVEPFKLDPLAKPTDFIELWELFIAAYGLSCEMLTDGSYLCKTTSKTREVIEDYQDENN